MVPENLLEDFVSRMQTAAGENLESIILYGSAAGGDFHPEFSNLNLFCVLRDSSFGALHRLAPVVRWWERKQQPPPLFMTREELEASTDVFAIELLDMQEHRRVLLGPDVVAGLQVPLELHRVQLEYELREKLVLLRQQMLLAGDDKRLWSLLARSAPSFLTLFRHALIALGQAVPADWRAVLLRLAEFLGFDPGAMNQVLDVRERKVKAKDLRIDDLFSRYMAIVERVVAAVDKALENGSPAQ